ncbi:MAG: AbrB family transcriptional regulator, partial [Pseudomonadota bacterium]
EMSNLARIHGADSELVSAAQSLRLTLVVLILPTLFLLFGVAGDESYAPAAIPLRVEWLAAMLFVAALLGWGAARLRITNAYVISGLMIGAIVAAGDLPLSGMWEPLTWLGQVLLGVARGARFRRDQLPLLRRVAPLFALVTLTALSLSSTLAAALSGPVGLSVPTLILALAPGGTAEMSITAKVLGLGAPMVTAFHMVRIASVVTLTSPVYRWTAGLRRRARVRATP